MIEYLSTYNYDIGPLFQKLGVSYLHTNVSRYKSSQYGSASLYLCHLKIDRNYVCSGLGRYLPIILAVTFSGHS